MEILVAAFGVTTRTTVAASVINAALEQQLRHLQELLRSAHTVWHSFPFGGNKYPWGCSKGGHAGDEGFPKKDGTPCFPLMNATIYYRLPVFL